MTDLTPGDLFGSDDEQDDSGGGGDGGQFALDMVDKLDSKGLLQPLVLGEQRSMDEISNGGGGGQPEPDTATDGGTAGDLDADTLKDLLLEVYDNTGMIPGMDDDPTLSDIIKLVDSNPEMVDGLLEEHL